MKASKVGERLRALRLAHEPPLKPSEMADLLEVERTAWTRWEKGHRPIPVPEAAKLTRLFQVDLDYILTGDMRAVPPAMQASLRHPPEDNTLSED